MNKETLKWWKVFAIGFPIIWMFLLFVYIKQDGCFMGGGKIACGLQAQIMLGAWFIFCMIWPIYYFVKILPQIKKEEVEKIQNLLKEEVNNGEKK